MRVSKATVNGKIYKVGDRLKFKTAANAAGYNSLGSLLLGDIVEIAMIKGNRSDGCRLFGLRTVNGRLPDGWHTLDGCLNEDNGYFVENKHIINNFTFVSKNMVVRNNFSFRKRNLKDMTCKVVSLMPGDSESIVEFDENIGGCGADGLGKGGHCLVIPNEFLLPEEASKKDKKDKKKKE